MFKMHIRKATFTDLPRILELYAGARAFMVQMGNPNQWSARNWPPEELILADIAAGKSYVCEGEEILAVFYFEQGQRIDPTYAHIEGAWLGNDDYGVVHRIASCRRQKGIGAFCIQWAYEQCGHLRIDTHADNLPMQNLLKKLGFVYCGTIFVNEDRDPRLAFEKTT